MKAQIFSMMIIILLASACSKPAAHRPSDFSLNFEWDTGALPPQYHYAYVVRIGSDNHTDFTYSPGYEPLTQPDAWQVKFDLTANQLNGLYALLLENDMLRSSWQTGQPLLGGSGTRLAIQADGRVFEVPSISVLDKTQRQTVEIVMDHIRTLVPDDVWREMEARQAQHEADFENQ